MRHICEICGYTTNRISNFKDHQNRKKPCKKKEIIDKCDTKRKNIQNIHEKCDQNSHLIHNHHDKIYKMMQFSVIYSMLNKAMKSSSELKCFKCDKTLSTKANLKRHIEKCKGIYNKLQCPTCLKIFAHRNSKNLHMKTIKCKPPDKFICEKIDIPINKTIQNEIEIAIEEIKTKE